MYDGINTINARVSFVVMRSISISVSVSISECLRDTFLKYLHLFHLLPKPMPILESPRIIPQPCPPAPLTSSQHPPPASPCPTPQYSDGHGGDGEGEVERWPEFTEGFDMELSGAFFGAMAEHREMLMGGGGITVSKR
jgi:hypothetical protein